MTRMHTLWTAGAAFGLLSLLAVAPAQPALAQVVFQAAGPDGAAILGTVEAFRAALGDNNLSNPGPIATGRREINWDGGGAATNTTGPDNPMDVFLQSRGARFTTPGTGLSQATAAGLADLFGNPDYANIFKTFSPQRFFTPVDSRVTDGLFFVPGTSSGGTPGTPATVNAFGAVFSDVDKPDGVKRQGRTTQIQYFGADGSLIFKSFVPSAPGDGGLSFFGVMFPDASIARVRITTGDVPPGPNDDTKDIVMMDDFIYGEPQPQQP